MICLKKNIKLKGEGQMIKENELHQIKGGASKWTVGFVIGAVVSFVAGLIDGFMRPLSCNG